VIDLDLAVLMTTRAIVVQNLLGASIIFIMPENSEGTITTKLPKGITVTLGLPWFEVFGEIWKQGSKLFRGQANEGMYEVLEYESTLELVDRLGKKALVKKREKVKYLQDNIIAYQDQAWGDGKILIDYQCKPGKPVDQYTPGKRTFILISLQEVKQKGDTDEFNIQWGMRNAFTRSKEQWETEIRHKTKNLRINLLFPKDGKPRKISVEEGIQQRTQTLDQKTILNLPNGRWLVRWEKSKPKLYERYILKWEW